MLYPAFPNPFNPVVTLDLYIPIAHIGRTTVQIIDITGRTRVTLLDEQGQSGYTSLVWNGRDDHGTSVPAGVYFVFARAGSVVRTQKILLLK